MELSDHQQKRINHRSNLGTKRDRIIELYESGQSFESMASQLEVSVNTLKEYLISQEIHKPSSRNLFSNDDCNQIITLRKKGTTIKEIASVLGRSAGVVKQKCRQLRNKGEL